MIKSKDKVKPTGRFRFKTFDSLTGEVKRISPWIENLIVSNQNNGLNLIIQRHIGLKTFDLEITSCEIGTGTNEPSLNDTNLQTPVTTGIERANQSQSNNVATLEFFISDSELPNDTYTEFGLRAGTQLYTRALIDPVYTKSSNEDTSIEYEIIYLSEEFLS